MKIKIESKNQNRRSFEELNEEKIDKKKHHSKKRKTSKKK